MEWKPTTFGRWVLKVCKLLSQRFGRLDLAHSYNDRTCVLLERKEISAMSEHEIRISEFSEICVQEHCRCTSTGPIFEQDGRLVSKRYSNFPIGNQISLMRTLSVLQEMVYWKSQIIVVVVLPALKAPENCRK